MEQLQAISIANVNGADIHKNKRSYETGHGSSGEGAPCLVKKEESPLLSRGTPGSSCWISSGGVAPYVFICREVCARSQRDKSGEQHTTRTSCTY